MAIIRCKMCGGDLEIEPDITVCECEYCGSKQTIPTADNEKKMKLFDRANRLRLNCEFDKAAAVYESIVSEFPEEAEGYWGNLLCAYGIEYVDDPATGNKIPTCHRSSFTCFLDEEDFEQVMENADAVSRSVYREQAKQIEEIRKGIIEVSGKEQPYDIFICYKETAEDGQRTIDSVLAQDVYDALTEKGYRVFFSRISLEDKLGTEYEPYIFAALNSAKVMLAFGTSYDYYNAVWVKNEWSRYLKLMAEDKSKHLIPCYKDIDAYDIPKEFRSLQAQDLGKVGAVQDLIHGIDKLLGKTEKAADARSQTVIQQVVSSGPNVDALLKRGYDSLEDGAFDEANTFFNDALNSNAQSAEAYLGLFMAEIKAANQSAAQSKYVSENYTENRYWKRARQYAAGEFAETLNQWDSLREARLRREADSDRRAKEEADRKAREAEENLRKEEETLRKKVEEIRKLQEQLRTGNFEVTAEEKTEQERLNAVAKSAQKTAADAESVLPGSSEVQEVARLEGLISSKKTQLAGLGFFKGKEKKELQGQIETLEGTLAEAKNKVSGKQSEIDKLKNQAEAASKQATEYSDKVMKSKKAQIRTQIFRMLEIDVQGKRVQFGRYEQGSGIKPIEWRVLEISDNGILLITEYAIDRKRYHGTKTAITWDICDLRKWLNREFLNTAFNETERSLIGDTKCSADQNPTYSTYPGHATTDKIFLLSILEAEKYFMSDEDRKAAPTAYAKEQGADTNNKSKTAAGEACCWWWLRSPGDGSTCAANVSNIGSIFDYGLNVDNDETSVRPALWIGLES